MTTSRGGDAVTLWCMATPKRFGRRGFGRALLAEPWLAQPGKGRSRAPGTDSSEDAPVRHHRLVNPGGLGDLRERRLRPVPVTAPRRGFVCPDSNPILVAQRRYRRRCAYILRSILDNPKPAHPPALDPQRRASRRNPSWRTRPGLHGLCVISLGPVGYPCAGTIPSPEVSARLPARVSAMPRPRSSGDRAPLS